MTRDEIIKLNEGRYTFRSEHRSLTPAKYRRLPGHVLVEEHLVPYFPANLSDLSAKTRIPFHRLRALVHGDEKIDRDMATKLAKFYTNTTAEYWLDLQARYDRGESL
jgi:addiction module HigA family antidote